MDDKIEKARTDTTNIKNILRRHTPQARPSTSHRGGEPRPKLDDALLTSPFRFVELNDQVVEADLEALGKYGLDAPREDGLCGTITVTWVAETPILIGEESKEGTQNVVVPMRMGTGSEAPFVIPGATLRGCLRAALEIVAAGRLTQINAHARYGRFSKVAHAQSVGDLRDRNAAHQRPKVKPDEPARIDLVEALFGHVLEPDEALENSDSRTPKNALARKGRVAFGFATAKADTAEVTGIIETVMAAPRASYAPFYLKGPVKDWSASKQDGTTLAGRKRYIPRFPPERIGMAWSEIDKALKGQVERLKVNGGKGPEEKMKSRLRFLKPTNPQTGIVFTGEIRLHNVSAVELGALLWVLTHGGDPAKPCRHMMGRGKPFGAGQIRVGALKLALKPNWPDKQREQQETPRDWERLTNPNTPKERGWLTETDWSMVPFLHDFHQHMARYYPKWPHTRDMAEFLASCDPAVGARLAERMAYPALKDFAEIRKGSKLSTRFASPDDRRTRYLPMLADGEAERRISALRLPYQGDKTQDGLG